MANNTALEHYLAPLRPYLDQPATTEVCINSPGSFFVENASEWEQVTDETLDFNFLNHLISAIAHPTGQEISENKPILSTSIPTGERVQVVIPPALEQGRISLTFRKASPITFSLEELKKRGFFSSSQVERFDVPFFSHAVKHHRNILVSGATGSGKTTFAKALLREIPLIERIITIEDTRELIVPHQNRVHMIYSKGDQNHASFSAKDLLESALRMRPDRILMQELRDSSAFFYLRNVNTGHPGSITTIHANSPKSALVQLMLLVKESEAGVGLSQQDIVELCKSSIDIIAHVSRNAEKYILKEILTFEK